MRKTAILLLLFTASGCATGPQGATYTWPLRSDKHSQQGAVHGSAGKVISLPYVGSAAKAEHSELSLLELRGATFVADRFKHLSVKDGFVTRVKVSI